MGDEWKGEEVEKDFGHEGSPGDATVVLAADLVQW